MTGKHHAAFDRGADAGEQVGLAAIGVGDALGRHPMGSEVVFDEIDQREVRMAGDGIEADQVGQEIAGSRHGLLRSTSVDHGWVSERTE